MLNRNGAARAVCPQEYPPDNFGHAPDGQLAEITIRCRQNMVLPGAEGIGAKALRVGGPEECQHWPAEGGCEVHRPTVIANHE